MFLTKEQIDATAALSSRQAARELGVSKTAVAKYRNIYSNNTDYAVELPKANILILDIESYPATYYSWGPKAEWLSSKQEIDPGGLLCLSYKWLGSPVTHFVAEWDDGHDSMVAEAHAVLSLADIVITYNGDRYDLKRLNNEFWKTGTPPPRPFRSIDLFKTNRAKFDLPYKSLDYLAQSGGVGEKLPNGGFDLWVKCMAGDAEARKLMEAYNKQDVILTEQVYVKLLPWLTNVPHMGMFVTDGACPYCGHHTVNESGETRTFVQTYMLYTCPNCEGWSRGNKPVGETLETRKI